MTFVVGARCFDTVDRSCIDVCPVDCIYEAGPMVVIHPTECIDCGACEAACPVGAILPAGEVRPGEEVFIAINAAIQHCPDAVAQRAGAAYDHWTGQSDRNAPSEGTGASSSP